MEFKIPFVISLNITGEELNQCFIDTRYVRIFELADFISNRLLHDGSQTNEIWNKDLNLITTRFPEIGSDGKKYLSFLSQPLITEYFNSFKNWGDIFDGKIEGFRKYTAMLSHIVNSAPGEDSLWPYGRHFLNQVDEFIYNKVIGNMMQGNDFGFDNESVDRLIGMDHEKSSSEYSGEQDEIHEITWRKIYSFYHLNDSIKTFGSLLCNFNDSVQVEELSPWNGLLKLIIGLDQSDNPAVNKVALRQTVFQIVSQYITLRRNRSDQVKLAYDLQTLKNRLSSFEEIQQIQLR